MIQRITWMNITSIASERNQTQISIFVKNASWSVIKKADGWLPWAKGRGENAL